MSLIGDFKKEIDLCYLYIFNCDFLSCFYCKKYSIHYSILYLTIH